MNAHPARCSFSWFNITVGIFIMTAGLGLLMYLPPQLDRENQQFRPDINIAEDFTEWWLKSAADFESDSIASNHASAATWMYPSAEREITQTLWSPVASLHQKFKRHVIAVGTPHFINSTTASLDFDIILTSEALPQKSHVRHFTFLVGKNANGYRVSGVK
jgi:hypothetical protein